MEFKIYIYIFILNSSHFHLFNFSRKKNMNIDNYTFNYIKMIKNDSSDIETVFNIKQVII